MYRTVLYAVFLWIVLAQTIDARPQRSYQDAARGHASRSARQFGSVDPTRTEPCRPRWLPTLGGEPGVNAFVFALAVYDDGRGGGPALYAGGSFTTAGGREARRVARWDGSSWSPVGTGMNREVRALATFDDGTGPALYAGGWFTEAGGTRANYVARWDGSRWSSVGSGMNYSVYALTVFDAGYGPELYAGGYFTSAGGVAAKRVARWNGTTWAPLAGGVDFHFMVQPGVSTMTVFDDGRGAGPALYVGGAFEQAGDDFVFGLARWDGTRWFDVDYPRFSFDGVDAIVSFDDGRGEGPSLYVSTHRDLSRWDGATWSLVASPYDDICSFAVFDDGQGPALYTGGALRRVDGLVLHGIARWDGTSWSSVGSGMTGGSASDGPIVSALIPFHDSRGSPILVAAGLFEGAGGAPANRIAAWSGTGWSSMGGEGFDDEVRAFALHDDGTGGGPSLYAGGTFFGAQGTTLGSIARWDGNGWSPLGAGLRYEVLYGSAQASVSALASFDDGQGPALYVGGSFTHAGLLLVNSIARWDGSEWHALGDGISGHFRSVRDLLVFDDGSGAALYFGGEFTSIGGVPADGIARWDGVAFTAVGSLGSRDLIVFDDGSGEALYSADGDVYKYDGAEWLRVGGDFDSDVRALEVFDDGSGPALYACGIFDRIDGLAVPGIARWNGTVWSRVGAGLWTTNRLAVFDDQGGAGPALYAGTYFPIGGGTFGIARWNGSNWSAVGSGTADGGVVTAMFVFDDGSGLGPQLYCGGDFGSMLDSGDSYLARWGGCPVDTVSPSDVGDLTSTTHREGLWSPLPEVRMTWWPALDDRDGLRGYSILWDHDPVGVPPREAQLAASVTSHVQVLDTSAEGWYFHIAAVDNADNWDPTPATFGPIFVDADPPTNGTIRVAGSANWTPDVVVDLDELGAIDATSGVVSMRFSNDGWHWSAEEPWSPTRPSWDLTAFGGSATAGTKTIHVQFRDAAGNLSIAFSDEIVFRPAPDGKAP